MKFLCRVVERKVSSLHVSTENGDHKKLKTRRKLRAGIKRLRLDVVKISEDQRSIKESQREVRKKLEAIKGDCAFIKNEAELITQMSEQTQQRLDLMFLILEARKNKDFIKANSLSRSLKLSLVTGGNDIDNGKALGQTNVNT